MSKQRESQYVIDYNSEREDTDEVFVDKIKNQHEDSIQDLIEYSENFKRNVYIQKKEDTLDKIIHLNNDENNRENIEKQEGKQDNLKRTYFEDTLVDMSDLYDSTYDGGNYNYRHTVTQYTILNNNNNVVLKNASNYMNRKTDDLIVFDDDELSTNKKHVNTVKMNDRDNDDADDDESFASCTEDLFKNNSNTNVKISTVPKKVTSKPVKLVVTTFIDSIDYNESSSENFNASVGAVNNPHESYNCHHENGCNILCALNYKVFTESQSQVRGHETVINEFKNVMIDVHNKRDIQNKCVMTDINGLVKDEHKIPASLRKNQSPLSTESLKEFELFENALFNEIESEVKVPKLNNQDFEFSSTPIFQVPTNSFRYSNLNLEDTKKYSNDVNDAPALDNCFLTPINNNLNCLSTIAECSNETFNSNKSHSKQPPQISKKQNNSDITSPFGNYTLRFSRSEGGINIGNDDEWNSTEKLSVKSDKLKLDEEDSKMFDSNYCGIDREWDSKKDGMFYSSSHYNYKVAKEEDAKKQLNQEQKINKPLLNDAISKLEMENLNAPNLSINNEYRLSLIAEKNQNENLEMPKNLLNGCNIQSTKSINNDSMDDSVFDDEETSKNLPVNDNGRGMNDFSSKNNFSSNILRSKLRLPKILLTNVNNRVTNVTSKGTSTTSLNENPETPKTERNFLNQTKSTNSFDKTYNNSPSTIGVSSILLSNFNNGIINSKQTSTTSLNENPDTPKTEKNFMNSISVNSFDKTNNYSSGTIGVSSTVDSLYNTNNLVTPLNNTSPHDASLLSSKSMNLQSYKSPLLPPPPPLQFLETLEAKSYFEYDYEFESLHAPVSPPLPPIPTEDNMSFNTPKYDKFESLFLPTSSTAEPLTPQVQETTNLLSMCNVLPPPPTSPLETSSKVKIFFLFSICQFDTISLIFRN